MNVTTVKSEGLAHNSYYLSSQGQAIVIDPRRDCEVYTQLAKQDCAQIKYIFETHRNEDFVVGSLELQKMTKAEIAHGQGLPFKYGEHNLVNGETLSVGNIEIKTLSTPGHTIESVCYVVYEGGEPILVFSGDTLFSGSVGRTDLYGKDTQTAQSEKLYISLKQQILTLDDGILVYPSHGAGSVCGHGISGQEPTTIGYEKKTNPYLQLSKKEFIQKTLSTKLVVPSYFRKMEEFNLNGAPPLSASPDPKPLSISDFEKETQNPLVTIVDTRLPYAFAGSHIPDSLSLWLGGTSAYPGWILDPDQAVVFVLERPSDIETVATRFRRVGFDNMCGYLCGGMNNWQEAGKPISSIGTLSVTELKGRLEWGEVLLLDVREPDEWKEEGFIDGANLIFFADLPNKTEMFSKEKPIAVTCSVGNRSSIAASLLKKAGFRDVFNVLGGMTAWTTLGYPTKH